MLISAIIVLYNPNQSIFLRLIESVVSQVNNIILVDNSTDIEIKRNIQTWHSDQDSLRFHYIDLHNNLGIAIAQNRGIDEAIKLNSSHVLLLDQDSLLPNNMVKVLLDTEQVLAITKIKVACVAPSYIDKKLNKVASIIRYKGLVRQKINSNGEEIFIQADHVIASGSLININSLKEIGSFREELFIDYVDIEWCLRAKQKGYQSFIAPKAIMIHDIGDSYVKVGDRNIVLHSNFRNYFAIRNSVYLILYTKLQFNFKLFELLKLPFYFLIYPLKSTQKVETLIIMLIGLKDGITKKMGKGYFQGKRL